MTSTHSPHTDRTTQRPGQVLLKFTAVALLAGWAFLSVPLFTGWPVEPFVLATLFLGMVPAALLLTRNGQHATVRSLLLDLSVNVVSSVLIVNLWEEMVWAGFVQRTAAHAYGFVRSALLTAALFVAIHLPLAFYGIDGMAGLGYNLAVMAAAGVGMRLLVGALDVWGRGSILAVAVLHATFNASGDLVDAELDWIRYAVTLGFGLMVLLAPQLRRSHGGTEELR